MYNSIEENSEKNQISTPLTLPCGIVLPNRIVKAPMGEFLCPSDGNPSELLCNLY